MRVVFSFFLDVTQLFSDIAHSSDRRLDSLGALGLLACVNRKLCKNTFPHIYITPPQAALASVTLHALPSPTLGDDSRRLVPLRHRPSSASLHTRRSGKFFFQMIWPRQGVGIMPAVCGIVLRSTLSFSTHTLVLSSNVTHTSQTATLSQ